MTANTRNPKNIDLLQSTKFRLTFDRLPGLQYFCTSANLPGISLTEIPKPTPFVELYSPGEKLIYDTLNFTFLVDEDLYAWTEVHDWMRGITFPFNYEEYFDMQKKGAKSAVATSSKPLKGYQYSQAVLTVYTNKNNPNFRVKFFDIFPTSLSTIIFNTADSAENIITADATFRFTYYNYERI